MTHPTVKSCLVVVVAGSLLAGCAQYQAQQQEQANAQAMAQGAMVVGADDAPFLAASDYMAARIPGAKKVVIPAAGHAVNIDQPQAFIDAVLPFLDGLPGSATKKRLVPS
jgi:hypothetical protein